MYIYNFVGSIKCGYIAEKDTFLLYNVVNGGGKVVNNTQILTTRNKPRRNIASEELNSPNSVRVYRASPEDVMLQLRRTKDYISIALSFAECRALAAMLVEAADVTG